MNRRIFAWLGLGLVTALLIPSCNDSSSATGSKSDWNCTLESDSVPASIPTIGCKEDFEAMASLPLDASISGAIALKTVVDLADGGTLYLQDSKTYKFHWDFASKHLSGNGKPIVPALAQFNETEYYSPDRRFLLGTLTRYENLGVFAYEVAPYDKASADMIRLAYEKIAAACYCADKLYVHPSSVAVEKEMKKLPASVKIITTEELYAGMVYQPLNFGASLGRLVFTTAKRLETEYVSFRDIVVLDAVPNDISVVAGIVTQKFQTPLSHINVLSQNRGTPNMGLKGAHSDTALKALEGKWVKLEVGANAYKVTEVTQDEADAWWEENRPDSVGVPNMDLETRELRDVEKILDLKTMSLGEAIKKAIPAFGGKVSHFSAFPHMDSTKITYEKAFGIPVYWYWQHMEKNGLNDSVKKWLADPKFTGDPAERDRRLEVLRDLIEDSPLDTAFEALLMAKIRSTIPGDKIRFRSSTNAEDLDGFTGAGLYDSKTGSLTDPDDPIKEALTEVWASVWYFRAFEERSYRNIDHTKVGMALLVHNAHPDEEANGVAITANPFDPEMLEPGFYINVQKGGEAIVSPTAGIVADQFIYYFDNPGQPIVFLANSTLVPKGTTVLTTAQTHALGLALTEINRFFKPLYGKDASKWWAMDTEFKLDQPMGKDGDPVIIMKQARPYPGWGEQ